MSRFASLLVVTILLTAGFGPAVSAVPTTDAATAEAEELLAVDARPTPIDSGADAATAPDNTTAKLQLRGSLTGNYSTVDLDFGGTMATSAERIESQYRVSLVTLQLERVSGRAARNAVVNAYLDEAVAELDELSDAEATATERYRTGEITAEALLVKLSMIDMRARVIGDTLTRIQSSSGPLSRSTLNRIQDVRLELSGFQSPIRRHVAKAAAGELKAPVNPLYVTASENGVVVEMLDDRRYLRNAIRFDNRQLDETDRLGDLESFQSRIEEVYAWSYPRRTNINIDVYTTRNLYAANYLHPQGSLVTFVDGGTTDVFREEQSLLLERLPLPDATTRTTNNTTVRVARTPGGGPFNVNVTHTFRNESGNLTTEPADAVVTVDGRVVGRTGSDGELWMLSPVDDYQIMVVRNETTVNVSVSP